MTTTSTTTNTDADARRRAKLAALGLPADGDSLGAPVASVQTPVQTPVQAVVAPPVPVVAPVAMPTAPTAPTGDLHTMPAEQVVALFDPAWLDGVPLDTPQQRNAANNWLFAQVKSLHRDPVRNSFLWRKVGEFVQRVRKERQGGPGHVRQVIAATNAATDAPTDLPL